MIVNKNFCKEKGDFIAFIKFINNMTSSEAIKKAEQIFSEIKNQNLNQKHLDATYYR